MICLSSFTLFSAENAVPSEQGPQRITTNTIDESIRNAQNNTSLEGPKREALLDKYNQIKKELASKTEIETRIRGLDALLANNQGQLKTKNDMAPTKSLPPPEALESWSLNRLEQELLASENELVNLRKYSEVLEGREKDHENRRLQLPKVQLQLRETISLQEGERKLQATMNGEADRADFWLQQANLERMKLELHLLEKEILSYDLQSNQIASDLLNNARRIELQENHLQIIRKTLRIRRQEEAEKARLKAIEAEEKTASSHPLIRAIATENTQLVEQLTSIRGKLPDEILAEKEKYQSTLKKIRDDYQNLIKRAQTHAIDEVLGFLFRKYQAELPSADDFLRRKAQIKGDLSLTQVEIFGFQEKLALNKRGLSSYKEGEDQDRPQLEVLQKAQKLLETQRATLEQLIRERNTYIYRLVDLDIVLSELVKEVGTFHSYIHENILWTRSHRPWNPGVLLNLSTLKNWAYSIENWNRCLAIAETKITQQPLAFLLFLLMILLQLVFRNRGMNFFEQIEKAWEKKNLITLGPIFQILGWMIFLALLWPTIYFFPAWLFNDPSQSTDFSTGLSRGFYLLSVSSFVFCLVLLILRRQNLGQVLLFWNGDGNQLMRRALRFLLLVSYPCLLFYTLLSYAPAESVKDPFQRVFFYIPMVALFIFSIQVLHPDKLFLKPIFARKSLHFLFHYRWIISTFLTILPLLLAVMSIFGYHYAAHQIFTKSLLTIGCLLSIILLRSVFQRFLILLRSRLRYEKLKENASAEGDFPSPPSLEPDDIQNQVQRFLQGLATVLLFVGIWAIWVELLPALQILKRVEIFSVVKQVSRQFIDAAGIPSIQIVDTDVTITLGDLLCSGLSLLITFIFSRNIPGMLEIFLLRKLKFAKGHSFAIVTLFQYLIVILGITIACSYVGISWDKVQWLAAALTVGLGFGLQEIFANFVAGIIILFEQPMRINDVVTVGDTTGKVSQIRIRATTITDFNNRELIVPNKDFITGNLINWSLSNSILRFDIPVGVSYKENPKQVERILLEIAQAHEDVLCDPEPVAIFKELADSSLNFELRFYTSNLDRFSIIKSEILTSILERLRLEEIEIPFPQRDINIKSVFPLSATPQN